MTLLPRQRLYLLAATGVFLLHLAVAAFGKPTPELIIYGDATPCVLLILAILTVWENFRSAYGIVPVFWKVFAGGLGLIFLSQAYWLSYALPGQFPSSNSVIPDSLFLMAHVFFLTALALRPHSASAGRDLRTRSLDFVLLSFWWLSLYGFFSLPWQTVLHQFVHYNPAYYLLAFIQHLVIILVLAILAFRKTEAWRRFYLQLMLAFVFVAVGNLLLSTAIRRGTYYPGTYYDTPFLFGFWMFTFVGGLGSSLQPHEDATPNRELMQSVWTARFAMLGILSLPVIALVSLFEKDLPSAVETFRLRLVFGATLLLGSLVCWKLNMLTRQLVELVQLTRDSVENLKSVQQKVAHSERLIALGRLASGATHEVSNPLTAILGYSELLADIPSLNPEDREQASLIQQHVHRAQAAVTSLRNKTRGVQAPAPPPIDKNPVS